MRFSAVLVNNILRLVYVAIFSLCTLASVFAEVQNIDNQRLQLLISRGTPIIDIREEFEWRETGIIPESHLITFFDSDGKYDVKNWLKQLTLIIKRDEPVIIICRSGRRSLLVSKYLSEKENFFKVYNVKDGIKGWKGSNLATEELQ